MKWWILIAIALLLAYLVYEIVPISSAVRVSADIVVRTRPFVREKGTHTMLVLGDSTAVGVGASDPRYSVAGRLSSLIDASVENHAVSGATTPELAGQLELMEREHYDLILIQIGANDVIKLRSLSKAEDALRNALATLSKKSDRIVLMTAGKIGEAPLFPWFLGPIATYRTALLRGRFMTTASQTGVEYIDLYAIPDPFRSDPARYYAADGLHPADDGYAFWYNVVKQHVESRWPELLYGQGN